MQRCEISAKGMTFGHKVSHSLRRTNRVWKPNLQSTKIVINGEAVKVKVCSKMLKTLKGASEAEVMNILKSNAKTLSPRLAKIVSK